MKKPLVEVIILIYNGKENIENCLNSLKKTKYPNFIVTVLDQASSDGGPELVEEKHPWVNLIRNDKNDGFAGGNNKILKQSKAKYCVLLNDDTEQDPNWIDELVKFAEQDEKISALQPKVLSLRDRKKFEHAGACGGFMDIYGYPFCRGRVFFTTEEDKGQYDDIKEIFWSCGVAMFLRMSILKEVGYLDEDFFCYSEEIDLDWRMNLAGYKQFVVPSSIIYHIGGVTSNKNPYQKEYLLHRNTFITLLKNYSRETWWRVVPIKICLEMIDFFVFLLFDPLRSLATLNANIWILFNLPKIIKKNKEVSKLRKVEDKEIMKRMVNKSVVLGYFLSGKKTFDKFMR